MKHFAIIYYSVAYYVKDIITYSSHLSKYDSHSIKEVPVFKTEGDVKEWLKDLETKLSDEFEKQQSRPFDITIKGVTITNIIKLQKSN